MIVGRITYDSTKQRQKQMGNLSPKQVPLSSEFMASKNLINERPLKSNLNDLSFKGLSFSGAENVQQTPQNQPTQPVKNKAKKDDKLKPLIAMFGTLAGIGLLLRFAPSYKNAGEYSVNEFLQFSKKYMGITKDKLGKPVESSIGQELLEHVKASQLTNDMVKIDGDKISFKKKTVPQLIWDGLIYPFKILPADILNGTVQFIGKIKPFKGWAQKTLDRPLFKNIRQRSKVDAQTNSLRGLFETMKSLNGKPEDEVASTMFQRSVKMFDPKTGNYDTKHERSLNRLVSGLPPAIFLANDAYNLSRMMDDDKQAATHEQKVRFKQEMARIGFNAYITLVTLGALNKYINNSKMGIMMMTALTTLTTEAFSRVINGKHITRLTPEEARKENAKNNAPEAQIKPEVSFKAADAPTTEKTNGNTTTDKATKTDAKQIAPKDDKEKAQKPLLSLGSVGKAVGAIIVGGFAIKGARKISAVDNAWKSFSGFFTKHYNKLTQIEDYKLPQEEFNKITKALEDNGFETLADKYKTVAAKHTNVTEKTISLGVKDRWSKPYINFVLAPFKFIWKYGTLPYKMANDAVEMVAKLFSKSAPKAVAKKPDELSALAKSVDNIQDMADKYADGRITKKQFHDYVTDNTLKAFNVDTMSNVSNSELSNIAKTAALAATIWFLMTDNYNMVMLKSNGNDVEGAKTKFKERFVQEGSRLFYQTLLIDLFNTTLSKQYHKSLFGMSWITLTNTTIGEWLTRKSVGVPVGTHSRDQLLAIEEKQEKATGFTRKYYDFMKRLTGKRSIKTYEVAQNSAPKDTKKVS